jgi:hypothetical protein
VHWSERQCRPSVGLPPPVYQDELRLCKSTSLAGTCEAGELCLPPTDTNLCIYAAGSPQCPADWPDARSIVVGVDDQRGCSECTCEGPTNLSCKTTITTFTDAACEDQLHVRETASGCGPLAGASVIAAPPEATGCTPNPVSPMGEVLPLGEYTVCCQLG